MSDTTRTWVNLRYRILSNEKRTSLQRGWAGGGGARSLDRAMTECSPHNCGSAVDRARERQFHHAIRAVMAGLDPAFHVLVALKKWMPGTALANAAPSLAT